MAFLRPGRFLSILERELAHIVRDEGLEGCMGSVTEVEVDGRAARARVFIDSFPDTCAEHLIEHLNMSGGLIRRKLRERTRLRNVPLLIFLPTLNKK